MASFLGVLNPPFSIFGIVAFVFAVVCVFTKKPTAVIIAILLGSFSLVFFSDPRVSSCEIGKGDFTCKRSDKTIDQLGDPVAQANFRKEQALKEEKAKPLDKTEVAQSSPAPSPAPSPPSPSPPEPSVPAVPPTQTAKGTVLVAFRDGQSLLANKIVSSFLSQGYKSAAVNSNLKETEKWVEDTKDGSVYVACVDGNSALCKNANDIVRSDVPAGKKVDSDDGWKFSASDAQVFLY